MYADSYPAFLIGKGEKMQHDFTKGNVAKSLLLFAIPIFGANILQAMYGTVDLLVVGLFSDASAVSAFPAQNVGAGHFKYIPCADSSILFHE